MALQPSPRTDPTRAPGYEVRDVKPQVVLYLAAVIFAVVVGGSIGLSWMVNQYNAGSTSHSSADFAATEPPSPQLQDKPARDYAAFDAEQNRLLHSYGWVDREKGIVRVPIDRAIDMAVERGLPKLNPSSPSNSPELER